MNNQLAIRDNQISLADLGSILTKSGYFQDARDASQAIVKVLAGQELGFGAIASMTGINIIKGRVSLSANLIAAAVKRSGRYNYRVRKQDDNVCEIEFFERAGDKWESIGLSSFTAADARRAGTQNMDKFPRNMLFARAMSNGGKWYCADVFGGPVYTPDELGAVVDGETGELIDTSDRPEIEDGEFTQPESANGNGSRPTNSQKASRQEQIAAALAMKTGRGTPFAELDDEKLKVVLEKGDASQKAAAALLLSPAVGDDWVEYYALAKTNPDMPELPDNCSLATMLRTMRGLAA